MEMPREEVRYYCDVCGAFFGKKEKAVECEISHRIPKEMCEPIYSKDDKKNRFPESILIKFDNGSSARYYRSGK